MKVWTTKGLKSAAVATLFLSIVIPAYASGALQFTEVMYDAPGADTGREWLEVTNVGAASIDLSGYKFFEGGVNHGVTAVQGTTSLKAGESAVIAANPQKFLIDYPGYAGTIFKSSFSLSNTGESVALKDKTLAIVDSLTYSSSMGASGDGNSLHKSAERWVPGAPNPGSSLPTAAIVKTAPASSSSAKVGTTVAQKSSTASKSAAVSASSGTVNAAAAAYQPLVQNISALWLYALGLLALVALGVGAVLYAKPIKMTETVADEFELQ